VGISSIAARPCKTRKSGAPTVWEGRLNQKLNLGTPQRLGHPPMARLTLARKMAAIALILWKKGEAFEAEHLKPQTA